MGFRRTWVHTCIHTYIHTYMHTRIRTYMHTYIGCSLEFCGIHGACARGSTNLTVSDCDILGCGRQQTHLL